MLGGMLIPVFADKQGISSTCQRKRGHGTQNTIFYTIKIKKYSKFGVGQFGSAAGELNGNI